METAKNIIFFLTLAVLVISPVQSEETQAAQISNTRTANCLVKVTCDPAILPMNLETLDYLLHSSGIGGKARREVLGISPDQDYDLFSIQHVQSFASDIGGVGLPPRDSQTGRSSKSEGGMNEYEYAMMMEAERGMGRTSTSTSRSRSSVSTSRPSSTSSSRSSPYGRAVTSSTTSRSRSSVPTSRTSSTSYSRSSPYGRAVTSRTTPSAARTPSMISVNPVNEQTYLFRLSVHLPEDVEPLAREFMKAIVDNLRKSLREANFAYSNDLEDLLREAESRRDQARLRLTKAMEQIKALSPPPEIKQNPADAAVNEQLEQIVDLSHLTSSMSFIDVITELKNSVDPPLQIQPNWKDLLENGEVEQTTPSGMDPLAIVKLRKVLDILLDGISGDFAELEYVVDEGVILIATVDSLPRKMIPRVYDIPFLAYSPGSVRELVEVIQNTIDPESWFDLGASGEGTITPYPRQRPKKLAIFQTYENHQKIWEFLQNITVDIPTDTLLEIPVEIYLGQKNDLLREKQNLEMELARLKGRMPAIEAQIMRIKAEIDKKVQTDQVSEELRNILALQFKYLNEIKNLTDLGRASNNDVADAEEKLARAKIELARRREQIGVSAGTDQLEKFSNEMAMLAIDMAEKEAMLEIVKNQLDQTEQNLTAGDMSDPQISRIRMTAQALEIAERRVNELNARLDNLQLPRVSVLGGE